MTIHAKSLPDRRSGPYRCAMAREATQMVVDELKVTRTSDADTVLSRDTAVPSAFSVDATLRRPPVMVQFEVRVPAGGTAQVVHLAMEPRTGDPTLTAGMLRGIALDRLLRDALKAAQRQATRRPDIAPNAYQVEGQPQGQFWVGAPAKSRVEQRSDEAAATAARVYLDALRQGSRAPAEAVAAEMDRSRGQVARYIRRARELNLLPPVGVPLDEWTPSEVSMAVWRVQQVPAEEIEDPDEGATVSFVTAEQRDAKRAGQRRRLDALYDVDPENLAGTTNERAEELARHGTRESALHEAEERRREVEELGVVAQGAELDRLARQDLEERGLLEDFEEQVRESKRQQSEADAGEER